MKITIESMPNGKVRAQSEAGIERILDVLAERISGYDLLGSPANPYRALGIPSGYLIWLCDESSEPIEIENPARFERRNGQWEAI